MDPVFIDKPDFFNSMVQFNNAKHNRVLMPMTDVEEHGTRKTVQVSGARVIQSGTKYFWYLFRTRSILLPVLVPHAQNSEL